MERTESRCVLLLLVALLLQTVVVGQEASENIEASRKVESQVAERIQSAFRGVDQQAIARLPIGVFDSGTGGLTVLEEVLRMDVFDNRTHEQSPKGDGISDFSGESFLFLADQANMPYGNYPSVGKERFLEELIVRDAEFLLGREYFESPADADAEDDKLPVKVIVIACNTATAYGMDDIQRVIRKAGQDVKVVGVIDAGAKGAVETFQDGRSGTIGVVPTRGTVLSGAYPRAIRSVADSMDLKNTIQVVQQGAFGLAGAVDGAVEFISKDVTSNEPRADYRGPALEHEFAKIDPAILKHYDFDFSDNHMLFAGSCEAPTVLQLNSVENYIKYHVVSLLENMKDSGNSEPLRAVILGCTHFPFFSDTFEREFKRLYELKIDGEYVYRPIMADAVALINPAFYTARELYVSLADDKRFRDGPTSGDTRGEFYITVPCRHRSGLRLSKNGAFSYQHKYGRSAGMIVPDFQSITLTTEQLPDATVRRLRQQVPEVWRLFDEFQKSNHKVMGPSRSVE